jgi:nucleotide-binding universal stress UspA family protein
MRAAIWKHILCPVDFGKTAGLGLRYAGVLARCSHSWLTVLYADRFEPPPYFTRNHIEHFMEQCRDCKAEAERRLHRFVEEEFRTDSIELESRVDAGDPADSIIRISRELKAGLIVMGTHGRSGLSRWTLGSVVERVLEGTQIPLLTVRPPMTPPSLSLAIRNILCPVNDTPAARGALGYATVIGQCFSARVSVLYVRAKGGSQRIESLDTWIPGPQRSRYELRPLYRVGEVAREIVAAASETSCDLIVIGAHRRGFFGGQVLGITTVRAVRHASCPVLSVPSQDSERSE